MSYRHNFIVFTDIPRVTDEAFVAETSKSVPSFECVFCS